MSKKTVLVISDEAGDCLSRVSELLHMTPDAVVEMLLRGIEHEELAAALFQLLRVATALAAAAAAAEAAARRRAEEEAKDRELRAQMGF